MFVCYCACFLYVLYAHSCVWFVCIFMYFLCVFLSIYVLHVFVGVCVLYVCFYMLYEWIIVLVCIQCNCMRGWVHVLWYVFSVIACVVGYMCCTASLFVCSHVPFRYGCSDGVKNG